MLRKSKKSQQKSEPVKREPFTYIHKGTTFEGRIEAQGRVRVHGVVKGDVDVDGIVEVAPAGLIVGATLRAKELRVLGRVSADVVVSGKVEIWNGGELVGDVRAGALDIEEGARFTGRSHMEETNPETALLDDATGFAGPVGGASVEAHESPAPTLESEAADQDGRSAERHEPRSVGANTRD